MGMGDFGSTAHYDNFSCAGFPCHAYDFLASRTTDHRIVHQAYGTAFEFELDRTQLSTNALLANFLLGDFNGKELVIIEIRS